MNELFFPVVGALVVFFVAVPLLTVLSRGVVAALGAGEDRVTAQESPLRVLLVVGPTLGPVAWLTSAAIHQNEAGAPLTACAIDHLGGEICRDVALFGLIVFAVLGFGIARRARASAGSAGRRLDSGVALDRVRRICGGNPHLAPFARRTFVVEGAAVPACTRGLWRPRVEIEAALVDRLGDDELEATLLHEVEHARAWDPLRFFIAEVALSINPLGRLLAAELCRHHFAREALSDRCAVERGADPLALARSIVSVAAPASRKGHLLACLGGHGMGAVRVRVQLLLGYAERSPGPVARRTPMGVVAALVMLITVLPHVSGTGPLDVLHEGIERAVLTLGAG